MKMFGTALLATTNGSYVIIFLGADMVAFFIYKIARMELRYWIRLDGLTSWAISILVRFIVKVLGDWTTNVQLRVSRKNYHSHFVSQFR